jgi:uncharacterized lipoprotein NlpE involved in copper resistance
MPPSFLQAGGIIPFVPGHEKGENVKCISEASYTHELIKKGTNMQALKKQLKQNLTLIFFVTLLLALHPAMAESDMQIQERVLKARELANQQNKDHAAHVNPLDKSLEFHGVFYGFLPCNDCNGIKTTLSLKQKNNYLLVTQPARESSREYYEKGKYSWNDETHTVVLTPRKKSATRQYYIENGETLIQLNSDGARITGDQADDYILRRSDTVKSREVHIH